MIYKRGDKVKIYGIVSPGENDNNYRSVINYCRGRTVAKVVAIVDEDHEMHVKVILDTCVSSRSLVGKVVTLHPKQCRKIKCSKK